MVNVLEVFVLASLASMVTLLLVTIALASTMRMLGFSRPRMPTLAKRYAWRSAAASILSGLTATWIFLKEPLRGQNEAWAATGLAIIMWSAFLILWDLLATDASDIPD